MQVAIDARELQPRPLGGVGRALAHVIPRLVDHVDLVLLTDARRPPVRGFDLDQHALRGPLHFGAAWLQVAAPRWLRRFDGIFHCPFYGLPLRLPVSGVASIYDLTFEHHPEWFNPQQRLAFRVSARRAARRAAAILTGSDHVRDDIVGTYGVPADRVVVAPIAVDPLFGPDRADPSVPARLGVPGPYLVTLGGAARRNHEAAIEAWRQVRAAGMDVSLAVVGTERPPGTPPEEGVVWVGRLPDPDWAAVLAGAEAFCYATRYEGFGMPALEACASGTPVVAARVGALPEVLGDAAVWSEGLDGASLADALSRALRGDPSALRAAALARAAAAPGWDVCAHAHLRAYRAASDGR